MRIRKKWTDMGAELVSGKAEDLLSTKQLVFEVWGLVTMYKETSA